METSNLMLGNLFVEENSKEIISVIGLEKDKIIFSGFFLDKWQAIPIKLNNEWFLKCKSNSIFNNGYSYKKRRESFEIYLGKSLITVIEFVHELQNLNFALLGENVVFQNES